MPPCSRWTHSYNHKSRFHPSLPFVTYKATIVGMTNWTHAPWTSSAWSTTMGDDSQACDCKLTSDYPLDYQLTLALTIPMTWYINKDRLCHHLQCKSSNKKKRSELSLYLLRYGCDEKRAYSCWAHASQRSCISCTCHSHTHTDMISEFVDNDKPQRACTRCYK
jgi:hypothetical protein